jgi:hypothetical protein
MSDESFAEILNDLQARGDRERLMHSCSATSLRFAHSLCCNLR